MTARSLKLKKKSRCACLSVSKRDSLSMRFDTILKKKFLVFFFWFYILCYVHIVHDHEVFNFFMVFYVLQSSLLSLERRVNTQRPSYTSFSSSFIFSLFSYSLMYNSSFLLFYYIFFFLHSKRRKCVLYLPFFVVPRIVYSRS